MKRSKLIANLIGEGFSEKTLAAFTDKQLFNLHERVIVKAADLIDPKVKTVVDKASSDPRNSVQIVKEKSEEELDEMFRFKDSSELAMDNLKSALETANIDIQGLSEIEIETVANDNLKIPFINVAYNLYNSLKDKENVKDKSSSGKSEFGDTPSGFYGPHNGFPKSNDDKINETKILSKKQKKFLDKNKNNKIDADDFKILKNKKSNESENLDENKKWIQKAIHPSKKGTLKKALGVKKDETIPTDKLKAAAKKGGKLGQRARFAMNVKKLNENKFYPLTTKNEILEAIKDNLGKIQKKNEEKPKMGNIFAKKKKDMQEAEPMVKPTPTTVPVKEPGTTPTKRPSHPGKRPLHAPNPVPKAKYKKDMQEAEPMVKPEPTTVPVKEPGTSPKTRPSHPGKRPLHAPNPVPKAKKISATDAKSKIIGTIKNILKNG